MKLALAVIACSKGKNETNSFTGLIYMKRLYAFDMDGTLLLDTTASLEIAKVTNTQEELFLLEDSFRNKKINTKEFARSLFTLFFSKDKTIEKDILQVAFELSPKLKNISSVVQQIKQNNDIPILITMSPNFFADFFYSYGFVHVFASYFPQNIFESFDENKILTPQDKPRICIELCQKYNLDFKETVALGDSMSDYPLFKELTHTVSVNGDKKISSMAKYNYKGNDLEELFRKFLLWEI